jgi:hypothetical protein
MSIVTVNVSIGPEADPLVISSDCDDAISWTALGLPEWEYRYNYAPPSAYVKGNVLLSLVQDVGAVPMVVSVQGTSLADMEAQKEIVRAKLAAWPGASFKVEAVTADETVTIAGPWESFPVIPKWGDVLVPLLDHYYVEGTFSLPVNP